MSNKPSVYITFPKSPGEDRWIKKLIESIRFSSARILGTEIEFKIKNIDFESINSGQKYLNTDLFLIVFSSKPEENEEFQDELKEVFEIIKNTDNNSIDPDRVLKILPTPNEGISQPAFLKPLTGYNFFEYAGKRKAIVPFDFDQGNPKTWARILDVVYDIKDTINILTNPVIEAAQNFVYLGSSSEDQINNRDDIRRELRHLGFRILPAVELPLVKEQIDSIVTENLSKCKLIIQIPGEQYGAMSTDGRYSVFEIENQAIKQFMSKNSEITGFLWIPSNLQLIDSKQELFINRLKRDDTIKNSIIIESAPGEFKEILTGFIESKKHTAGSVSGSGLYIISQHNANTDFIENKTRQLSISYSKDFLNNTVISYKHHLEMLENTDNILIYYNTPDIDWLRSKTGDAVKALGMGRKTPFKQIAVLSKDKIDLSEFGQLLGSIENITESDSDGLNRFINKILQTRNDER